MSDKQFFWIGPGVVTVGEKEYGGNDPLPVEKIDKTTFDRWSKQGKVGEKLTPALAPLERELEATKKELESTKKELAATHKELADAEADLEKLEAPGKPAPKRVGKK